MPAFPIQASLALRARSATSNQRQSLSARPEPRALGRLGIWDFRTYERREEGSEGCVCDEFGQQKDPRAANPACQDRGRLYG